MELDYTIVSDRKRFGDLRQEWNDLVRRSDVDHAFMRHEWFTAWLANLPFTGEIRILLARSGDRLVGAAPLCLQRLKRRGVSFNALCFVMSAISPRCHFVIDREQDPTPVFQGVDAIAGWDLAELKSLATDAPLTGRLVTYLERRGDVVVESGTASPYQELPATWEEFEQTRSKGFRKRFRNSLNRCEKDGTVEIVTIDSFAELERHFEDILSISRNSWKAEGGTDLVTQSRMAEFFRDFARLTEVDGLWVVYLLYLHGKPAAFDYYLRHANRLVGLRWEYDDSLRYYMPGVVVHVHALKDILAAGNGGEYDLAGTETDFKSGLVDTIRHHVDITFGNGGLRSRMLMTMKQGLVRIQGNQVTTCFGHEGAS